MHGEEAILQLPSELPTPVPILDSESSTDEDMPDLHFAPKRPCTTTPSRAKLTPAALPAAQATPPTLRVLYVFCGIRRKSDLMECLQSLCTALGFVLEVTQFDTEIDPAQM